MHKLRGDTIACAGDWGDTRGLVGGVFESSIIASEDDGLSRGSQARQAGDRGLGFTPPPPGWSFPFRPIIRQLK